MNMKILLALALACVLVAPGISAVSAAIFQFNDVDRAAGTVGEGHPDKPKVSLGKLDFYPAFESKAGLVTPRNVYVWVPDDYTKSKEYAVMYMSDGQNLFDPEKMFNHQAWEVDDVFGGLLEEGKIQDCIVVGVANVDPGLYRRGRGQCRPHKNAGVLPAGCGRPLLPGIESIREEYADGGGRTPG